MSLADILGLNKKEDESEVETEPEPEPTPAPQYATVEQMQQMIQGVSEQLQNNLLGYIQGSQQQQQPQQPQMPQIEEPSLDQIAEAWEEGETKKALQLQAQRDQAREMRYNYQLQQVYQHGQQEFANVNKKLVNNVVPDYQKYEKDVANLMEEVGLPKEYRSNLQIIELLTNSVKGRNIDKLVEERIEAMKRQENDAETATPGTVNRGTVSSVPPQRVVSEDAEMALNFVGKDKESFAKARGYQSWSDYENNVSAYQQVKRGQGSYMPKWRRAKQQGVK